MSLGIPYMGSKRKLAGYILKVITSRHSNITDFYDLFGGGGSVSFTAVKDYRFNVHYNELNSHIYQLIKYLKENKELEPKFFEWVSREEFFKQINKSNNDADWYSGYVMSCWSFGNRQLTYLYGSDIEESKRLAHDFIVNKDLKALSQIGISSHEMIEIIKLDDLNRRRVLFCNRVQHLERLQMIENLSRMQNLQNLAITNLSYEQVQITGNNPVIYCDIPYKGTVEYKEGGFDHDKFYQWFANLEYTAYLSEYDAPFEKVEMFSHRKSLSATNNKKKTVEKLFWNGKGNINQTKLF